MQRFKDFRPSPHDQHIAVEGKEDWFVLPCGMNRDSPCWEESNFQTAKDMLQDAAPSRIVEEEGEDWEELSFNHWACGHFSILVVRPNTEACKVAEEIERKLENYPLLDEDDVTERQHEEANLTWKECYNNKERANYIRKHSSQFEFHDMTDLMQCVRGYHFAGYASELIGE